MKINFNKSCSAFQKTSPNPAGYSWRSSELIFFCFPPQEVNRNSWRQRPGMGQLLPTGEACLTGQPGCQVASAPAGWARSNQGCETQLELQHLLSLHSGGWRQRSAQSEHKGSDLEEGAPFLNSKWKRFMEWAKTKEVIQKRGVCVWHLMDHSVFE